jgi:hypothetical protein
VDSKVGKRNAQRFGGKSEGGEMLDKTSPGGNNIKNHFSEEDGKI